MAKSNTKEPMDPKYKRYWAIGIVLTILVAALLIWNSSLFQKEAVAATVGEQEYSDSELMYYYNSAANTMISQVRSYQQYGLDMGYDTDLSPQEQYYDEASGTTYADYFMENALDQLQRTAILCDQAAKASYTLSAEGKESLKSVMDNLKVYAAQNGTTDTSYIKAVYGMDMTKSHFKEMLTNDILADEYAQAKSDEFTYDEAALDSYYEDNKDDLDSFEYRSTYVYHEAEGGTDEDGNPVDPTDEEIEEAMAVAKEKADAMVAAIEDGAEFGEAAEEALDGDDDYSDPDFGLSSDVLGSELNSSFSEWLMDSSREEGDITSIEVSDTGYVVVQYLNRARNDESYQTMDYRNILVLADTTEDEEGNAVASEEQLAAAEEKAQSLLEEWKGGDATAESFAALASANSADEETKSNGGLNEEANRSSLSGSVSTWLFDADRKEGDADVVEYIDSTGNVAGYQILFVESFGEIRWEYLAANALRSDDYAAWYESLQEEYPVALADGAQDRLVPPADVISSSEDSNEFTITSDAAESEDSENTDDADDADTIVEDDSDSDADNGEHASAEDDSDGDDGSTDDEASEAEEESVG